MEKKVTKIVIIICSVFLLLTVLKSFYFSNKTGGGDLRSRIVSSRMLFTDMSPYFYKWQPGDNEFYLDPNIHFDWPVNTNVSTPAELLVIYPVSILPYKMVRYIWTMLELIAATLTLILVYRSLRNSEAMVFLLVAVGVIASDIWMYHSDRGQKYIFYTFFLSLIFYVTKRKARNAEFFAGIISGLFVFFRPFMGILIVAWFLGKNWQMMKGWAMGIVLGLLFFVLPFYQLWVEYFSSMHLWKSMFLDKPVLLTHYKTFDIPSTVEGMKNINLYTGFNIESLDSIPHYIMKMGFQFSNWMSYLFFGVLAGAAGFLFLKGQRKNYATERMFILGFLLYIIATISFPVPRNGYCLVQWIFALPILIMGYRTDWKALVILFSAMLLLHNFPFFFPEQAFIAEIIFIFFSFRYLTKMLKGEEPENLLQEKLPQ